jgi:alanine dehydrogenase
MDAKKQAIRALAQEAALLTQEETLEIARKHERLTIGIPKETSFQEKRVALVPEAVAMLVAHGHEVVVQSDAGKDASIQDRDYSEAGARIAYDAKQVFECNMILKVAPPSTDEIEMMPGKQTLLSALQLTVQSAECLKKMMAKKITAIAWDYIRDETGIFPVVRAMGEIAGNTSMLIAAEYLSNANNGQGLMLGGISGVKPSEVIILGAGTVGEFAARAALGLGASVKVFDNSIYKLRRLQNDLGYRLWTSTIQPSVLEESLVHADVVIGALRAPFGRTPCVVTDEMVSSMKHGAVIVDISIDQGGCFETSRMTTHDQPTFKEYGVIHYCVPNVASRVSRTASYALSNIFAPIIVGVGADGGWANSIGKHEGIRDGVYMFKGTIVNEIIGDAFGLPHKHIDLLLAAL